MSHLDAHLRYMCEHDRDELVALLARSVPVEVLRHALHKASGDDVNAPPRGPSSPLPATSRQ